MIIKLDIDFPGGKYCNDFSWDKSKIDKQCVFFDGEWFYCKLLGSKPEWDEEEAEFIKLPECPVWGAS